MSKLGFFAGNIPFYSQFHSHPLPRSNVITSGLIPHVHDRGRVWIFHGNEASNATSQGEQHEQRKHATETPGHATPTGQHPTEPALVKLPRPVPTQRPETPTTPGSIIPGQGVWTIWFPWNQWIIGYITSVNKQ